MTCKISIPIDAPCVEGEKNRCWDVSWMKYVWWDSYTWIVYDLDALSCRKGYSFLYKQEVNSLQSALVTNSKKVCGSFSTYHHLCPSQFLLVSEKKSVRAIRCSATWKHYLRPQCGLHESLVYSQWLESFAIRRWGFHDLALNVRSLVFLICILDHSLAQGRRQLDPFGLAGFATLQGIADALRISSFLLALSMITSWPRSSSRIE